MKKKKCDEEMEGVVKRDRNAPLLSIRTQAVGKGHRRARLRVCTSGAAAKTRTKIYLP